MTQFKVHVLFSAPVPVKSLHQTSIYGHDAGTPSVPVEQQMSLASEYGKDQQRDDLDRQMKSFGCLVTWHDIHLENMGDIVREIISSDGQAAPAGFQTVILQLCDGTEDDGWPGASVVKAIEASGCAFTGSGSDFYLGCTRKTDMKRMFAQHHVPTCPYVILPADGIITSEVQSALQTLCDSVSPLPVIVKPDVSYGSSGIEAESLAYSVQDITKRFADLRAAGMSECFVEAFVKGREFTALVSGDERAGVRVWGVAERKFDEALPWQRRMLTFTAYWAISEKPFYSYHHVESELNHSLTEVVSRAYAATGGSGYARVDLRMNSDTGDIYVLEVNPNCGLASGADSSAGQILMLGGFSMADFLQNQFQYALVRQSHT